MKKKTFKKNFYFSVIVCLSLFAVCGSNLQAANYAPQDSKPPNVGIAPKFTLSVDGKSVSLADFPNQYVALNFWSSSSPGSEQANAEFNELAKKYPRSKVGFVDISIEENADIAEQYDVRSAPAIYLISPDGFVFDVKKNSAELEELLNALLK